MAENTQNLGIKVALDAKDAILSLGKFALAYEAVKTVLADVVGIVKLGIQEFNAQEMAVSRLTSALKAHGVTSQGAVQSQIAYADALSKTTVYTKNSIIEMEGELAVFGLTGQALKDATHASLELAAAKGMSLSEAANVVGRAFEGETMMLKRQGIEIDQTLPKGEKFAAVLQAIAKMGVVAEAQGDTLGGSITRLQNRFDEVTKNIGQGLAPLLKDIVIPAFNKLAAAAETIITPQNVIKSVGVLEKFLVDVETYFRKAAVIIEEIIAKPFDPETYKDLIILGANNLLDGFMDFIQNKIPGAFHFISDIVLGIHKEAVQRTVATHKDMWTLLSDVDKKGADEKAAIDKKTAEDLKKTNQGIVKDTKGTTNDVIAAWYESSKTMIDLGKAFAADWQKGLSKGVDLAFFGTKGIVEQNKENFTNIFGAVGGEFVSGALGGIVASGINTILTNIFGSKPTLTVAEYAESAFDRMVNKTNIAIDNIGKQKTDTQKRLDVLNTLQSSLGTNAVLPPDVAAALGLSPGVTVVQGMQQIGQQLTTIENQPRAVLQSELQQDVGLKNLLQSTGGAVTPMKSTDFLSLITAMGKSGPEIDEVFNALKGFKTVGDALASGNDRLKNIVDSWSGEIQGEQIALDRRITDLNTQLGGGSAFTVDELQQRISLAQTISSATGSSVGQILTKGFATGGVVSGNSFSGDNVVVKANSGEMVLTQDQQAKLWQLVSGNGGSFMGGSGSGAVINISGVFMGDRKQAQELAKMIDKELVVLDRQRQRLAA